MSAAPVMPNPEAPRAYDREPGLREILPLGAVLRPGLVYAYVLLQNIPTAESRGFTLYPGLRSFTIYGQTCMLMVGGKAIPGGRDTDTVVRPYVDGQLVVPASAQPGAPAPAPQATEHSAAPAGTPAGTPVTMPAPAHPQGSRPVRR